MKPIADFSGPSPKYVFTDIDDTITSHGQLPSGSYEMLWKLKSAGIEVVPVTGRPAGWCDMIARFWPVRGVVGENGAFYFSYDGKKMKRTWVYDETTRLAYQQKLKNLETEILKAVPKAAVSADQFCRLFDLAIDFCEDIPPLPKSDIEKIVQICEKSGAQAKVSSIHVNTWFGTHDKLSMCKTFCKEELKIDLDKQQEMCAFTGDSPNDEPMFAFFKNSFGVANVLEFEKQLKHPPQYVATKTGGDGFVEIAHKFLTGVKK